MDYIIKNRLQNKYPSILNYNTDDGGYIYLDGAFSKENYIAWKKPKISQLKYTPNTSFRFIVEFKTSEGDKYSRFYTSESYYKDLVASQKDNNPYFSKASFKKDSIVVINLNDLIAQRTQLDSEEVAMGIRVVKNVLFDTMHINPETGNEIDYDAMVVYVDWLIQQQKNYNADNGGVIPATELGIWNLGIYNRFTGKYQSEEEFNHFIYIRALEDQVKGVDDVISSLNFLYANPESDVAISGVERAVSSLKVAVTSVGLTAAGFFTVGVAAALSGAATFGLSAGAFGLAAVTATVPVVGWVAAALIIAFAAFFGGKSQDEKRAEAKREAVKKYCLEELDKFKRLREEAVSSLENAKKLAPEARKPIQIVNSDTSKLKQTAFEYDDERFQTKNERRFYSANMKVPISFSVLPGTKGGITTKKTEVEPDTIELKWATITNN